MSQIGFRNKTTLSRNIALHAENPCWYLPVTIRPNHRTLSWDCCNQSVSSTVYLPMPHFTISWVYCNLYLKRYGISILVIFYLLATLCSPLKVSRRFGGTYRLHLQVRKISRARNQRESRWLVELILPPWRWRRYVPLKRQLTFNGLQGVISQKMVLFIEPQIPHK
jgi:hypothetical protein